MRRRPALPVAALLTVALLTVAPLTVALLSLAGCTASAKPAQPAPARQSASAPTAAGVQQHDHGQAGQGATGAPAIVPRGGVVKMQVDEPGPTDVEFQWRPGNLVVSPGQSVTLEIANNDYMQHNFLFQAAKVNRNLPVRKVTTVRFTAPSAGTYAFWCKYHLQMMKGSITVR